MNWYIDVLKKYAVFTGRARRTEYWMFVLFNILVILVVGFLDNRLGTGGILGVLYSLGVLLPSLGVAIRRLHDTDRSGWWLLICLVPLVGCIILFIFMVLEGTPGDNRFGPNPKAA